MHFHAEQCELLTLAHHLPLEASLTERGGRPGTCGGGSRDLRNPALPLCKGAAVKKPCMECNRASCVPLPDVSYKQDAELLLLLVFQCIVWSLRSNST